MSYSRFVPVSSMFMLALSACAVQQPDTQESTTQPGQPSPQIGQGGRRSGLHGYGSTPMLPTGQPFLEQMQVAPLLLLWKQCIS